MVSAQSRSETLAERSAGATRAICAAIGLGALSASELKLLTVALAEQATAEATRNPAFAERVRLAFHALRANPPGSRLRSARDEFEPLVPTGPIDPSLLTPQGRLDPYALYRAYGADQTRRLLASRTLDDLKRSAAIVETKNPGTKPANRRARAPLVDYILAHLTA